MVQTFQNNSCSPFLAANGTCDLGNLAQYAINIADASSMIAGIQFARKNNIRLIVKNTGHDFLGRSTGKGSLALWTHNLKGLSFTLKYSSRYYSGPAAKVGAGVEVREIYAAASARGYKVVGGGCPTVGVAGGWLPGGGHGPLTSAYGLGADNVLEYEVVTLEGRQLTVSPIQNSDLYWALSGGGGGGGGTYAIVLSVTLKAHLDGPVAGTQWAFANTNPDTFWAAIEAWTKHVLVIEQYFPTLKTSVNFNSQFFELSSVTLPDEKTADKLNAALDPFLKQLAALNISLVTNTTVVGGQKGKLDCSLREKRKKKEQNAPDS